MESDDPKVAHQLLAAALDEAFDQIAAIQQAARYDGATQRPMWPMIVLRTPKGWTGPAIVDGQQVEGDLALPPGSARRDAHQPRAPKAIGGMAAQL